MVTMHVVDVKKEWKGGEEAREEIGGSNQQVTPSVGLGKHIKRKRMYGL